MPNSAPTKIAPNTPAASATRRPAAALVVTSAGEDYHELVHGFTNGEMILTAVKLALAFVLGDGTPETEELSVPFAMVVGYRDAEEIAEVTTVVRMTERVAAEETGASLVAASVVAAALLAGAAADDGAGADDGAAEGAAEDGAAEVWTGAAEGTAPVLPASGTSSCLPASGSVSRPHFSPALLRVPP